MPLDSMGKKRFFGPARRLIEAQQRQYRSYHEHPIQRDMIAEYDAIAAWGIVTCCYSGIEQSLKCLLKMRNSFEKSRHYNHNIGQLFKDLVDEEKDVLRKSYSIFRSLHDYIEPETVDRFLEGIDKGYQKWRYFLLDGEMPPTTHAGAMLEIWSTLTDILQARVFTNHVLNSVEQRIDHHLDWVDHICETSAGQRERDDIIRWMRKSHKNVPMNAYADLIYHHAESTLDLIELLPSTREILNRMVVKVNVKWVDNDFAYFLRRAQMGEIVWNPDENLFEKVRRSEEIKIKLIESGDPYVRDFILVPSVKAEITESVPAYIEDFLFEPRTKAERVSDNQSNEDLAKEAFRRHEEKYSHLELYEGGNDCEGYRCHINGVELVIVLYDSNEWIVYRYHNDDVPGLPHHCKHVRGKVRSIREAIKAIEKWRRTEKKEFEAYRKHMWNRRGKRRTEDGARNEQIVV